MIHGTYNLPLVALSLLFSMLSSYLTLDLAARIRALAMIGWRRTYWLLGGATVMGMGIWSMHFIGMIAFRMPMQIHYDPWITGESLLIAIATAYLVLRVTSRSELSNKSLASGGLLMGLGVAAMHYTGMAAMRMAPPIHFRPWLVLLSIIIAVAASWAALRIAFRLPPHVPGYLVLRRCGAGLVMGVAIAGMHYVGMAAAEFSIGSVSHSPSTTLTWLIPITSVLSLSGLVLTLVLSNVDSHFDLLLFDSHQSLAKANQQLQILATVDALTGLPNRACFLETIERRIVEARQAGTAFSVMFIDLDGFKTINDSLGHASGDELLKAFAAELGRRVRVQDFVARLGGDEFVILTESPGRREDVVSIAEGVLHRMQKAFVVQKLALRITSSLGIATYPEDGEDVTTLLKNADIAMYDAKQHGKNAYRFFDTTMSEAATRTLHIYRGLSLALEHHEFLLAFQPKFASPSNHIAGAEALIRWQHPEMGDIAPADFIPIAERTGQIAEISEWVIGEVCRQMKGWEAAGLPKIKIAINLSPEQLRLEQYVDRVAAIVAAAGISPQWIMFEITETVAMHEPDMACAMIHAFRTAGFDIAIDDFGTGYSSMAYLQKFRVKELKIDRFFTGALDDNVEGHTIVKAMIGLAHSLHMIVVAEGVETASQLKILNSLACDQVQGYFLARPMTATAFEVLLGRVARDARELDATTPERSPKFLTHLQQSVA